MARRLARVLGNVPAVDNAGALALLEPAIAAALKQGSVAGTHPDLIEAQALRGRLLAAVGRADEGLALLAKARTAAASAHGVRSTIHRAVLREAGLAHWYRGDLGKAIDAHASAYAVLAADQPFASEARAFEGLLLARHLLMAHQPAEAEPFVEEAEAALQAVPEPTERENRAQWVKLRRAWLLYEFGDHDQARGVVEAVIAKARADGNVSLEAVARGMSTGASANWERRGPYLGAPDRPAERRIAEVLRRYAVMPEVADAIRPNR